MTESEAKEYMKNEVKCITKASKCDRNCGKCELVKEEAPLLEAFRIAIEALEKQIPMKVNEIHVDEYICPRCLEENGCNELEITDEYCPKCGQRLMS